jgi:putative transposase
MIKKDHELPVVRQCQILELSRSSVYYRPAPVSDGTLRLMKRIDELHMAYPFYGSRKLKVLLRREGFDIGRRHVQTLMGKLGIEALYRKPRLSVPGDGHRIYPYLLRDMKIERPNQVWCTDITYIPLSKGFAYLVAVMDWHSRKVLAWRLSNTMETDFCIEALEEALARHGTPEIFNTDQGSQFTSTDFTQVLLDHNIRISMDGKGRWMDNVFIERLWRSSLKYDDVYLKAYDSIPAARTSIGAYFDLYNRFRPHQSLTDRTPDDVYYGDQALPLAA